MTQHFESIVKSLRSAGFLNSSEPSGRKPLDFKITEYNLNTDLSFKFDNVTDFKEFLRSMNSGINEERIENTLNDFNIDSNKFFYVNFFEREGSNQ